MQTNQIERSAVEAMLHRARIMMVQAYIGESGIVDPQRSYTHWQGFASCAKVLLNGQAVIMALHDKAGNTQGVLQAAFSRLPDDFERLSLADMKRHMWSQGVYTPSDLVSDLNVNAVEKFQHAVSAAFEADDEHSVARVDADDGSGLHGAPPVVDAGIVTQGGAA